MRHYALRLQNLLAIIIEIGALHGFVLLEDLSAYVLYWPRAGPAKILDCALCALQGIRFGLFLTRGARIGGLIGYSTTIRG